MGGDGTGVVVGLGVGNARVGVGLGVGIVGSVVRVAVGSDVGVEDWIIGVLDEVGESVVVSVGFVCIEVDGGIGVA